MAEPNRVKKKDLIESAKRCIAEKGIQKLTLKTVGEGAGVSQGTVYYHFKTKEQLMIEIVHDICQSSWEDLAQIHKDAKEKGENWIQSALSSAYERNTKESYFHHLFLSLVVIALNNEKMRGQIGELLTYENKALQQHIESAIGTEDGKNELYGISSKVWGILFNALIDGLAIQALMNDDINMEEVYKSLESLLIKHLK